MIIMQGQLTLSLVLVYMPGSRTSKAYKLLRPYHGPIAWSLHWIAEFMFAHCPAVILDTFWPQKTPPHGKMPCKVADNTPDT